MEAVQGPETAASMYSSLQDLSPEYADYVVEAGFADVYGRPGLDLSQRLLLNVAVLTALGGCEPQLAVHLRGALHVGVSSSEIVEAIFHVSLYAGHPRAINALRVAREVFESLDIAPPQTTVAQESSP